MKESNLNEKKLKSRYLVWLYKTTKEQLDRIDRKFTQLEVDRFIQSGLEKDIKGLSTGQKDNLAKYLNEFKEYIAKKEAEAGALKFDSQKPKKEKPEYVFLKLKLKQIEKKIEVLLGKKALEEISDLYEQEMLRRIIEEREHK